ncbi:MAG: hypothetical protein ABI580_03165, partial [Burkholderiaceae bacterium]
FSVQLFSDWPLTALADQLRSFKGLKAAFLQDEYERTEMTRQALESLQIRLVFTCVPEAEREKFYPQHRFSHVTFVGVLTGYVPLDFERHQHLALPLSERPVEIGYRGRRLAYWYGSLAMEKWWIGRDVDALCHERGVVCDIEWSEGDRLYDDDWYRFLGRCVATLGCESGANLIDEHGEVRRAVENYLESRPEADFEEVHAACLHKFDHSTRMNQISPRVFEAIAMRTALILYEGEYSGVIEPDRHYFSLKKDYSNFDDAVSFIRDPASVYAMIERAFSDIVASGRYGHESLAAAFDSAVGSLASSGIRQSTAEQWPSTSAHADESLRFILLDGEVGDSRRAVAEARGGLPSGELLHTDTCFVTLQQRDSFLGARRLRQSTTGSDYIARLPPCRISDLQLGVDAPGSTPVNGRVALLFCGRQTYSQAIALESGAPATIAVSVLADEIRVAFERGAMALAPSVRGKVRRITGVHSLIPPERAATRAAKRLWHTLPLPLRLSPWGMRAKALARSVRARWRPVPDAEKMEPLIRRR